MAIVSPSIELNWSGKSVTGALAPFVKSFSYIDQQKPGEVSVDTLSLTLNNGDGRFLEAWHPQSGDVLDAHIKWAEDGKVYIWSLGQFTIDSLRFRWRPSEVIIGASSHIPNNNELHRVQSVRYEDQSLETILSQCAATLGVTLTTAVLDDQRITAEQRSESLQAFLARLSADWNIPINFKGGKLVAGQIAKSQLDVNPSTSRHLQSLDLPQSVRSSYSAVTVDFFDSQKNESVVYTEGNAEQGKTLRLYNIPVSSIDEARRYAKAQLTSNDTKQEARGRMTWINTPLHSGQEVSFEGIGKLPKRWFVEQVSASLARGKWFTSATLKRNKD